MEALLPLVGMATTGSHATLVRLARDCGPLSSAAVVLVQELLKLVICICVLLSGLVRQKNKLRSSDWLLYFVPALSYAVNNNIAVYLQTQMDPATFHVLCNFKILTTALLYRLMLRRVIGARRWLALALLALGSALAALSAIDHRDALSPAHSHTELPRASRELAGAEAGAGVMIDQEIETAAGGMGLGGSPATLHVTLTGLAVLGLYCLISGFAGVYTEKLMRQQMQTSIFEQGIRMYTVGVVVNGLLFFESSAALPTAWCPALIALVVSQAANGFIMAYVMKHAGNILRLFVISASMVFASVLSWLVFDLHLTVHFLAAVVLIITAFVVYHFDPAPTPAPPPSHALSSSPQSSPHRLVLPTRHKD